MIRNGTRLLQCKSLLMLLECVLVLLSTRPSTVDSLGPWQAMSVTKWTVMIAGHVRMVMSEAVDATVAGIIG